jgi:tetratricopeptide (TPR) repeat protein
MVDIRKEKIADKIQMAGYLTEMIDKNPKNPDLFLKLAELHLDLGEPAKAETAIRSYESLEENKPEADLLKSKIVFQLGDTRKALEIAENLFLDGYESIELHELLYRLYYESKEYLKAIDQINYALEKNPANQEYYYNKSICYIQNRDTLNALAGLEVAINNGYKAIHAISQYVDLLVAVNNQKKALQAIHDGLKIEPENPDLNTAYARLLKNQDQFRQAKDILFGILAEDTDNYKALAALSEVYLDTYSYDSALFYTNRAIQLNKNYFPPYFAKAAVFELRKNHYSALEIYSQVLEKDPDNPVALFEYERIRSYLSYNRRLSRQLDSTRQAIRNLPKPVKKTIHNGQ